MAKTQTTDRLADAFYNARMSLVAQIDMLFGDDEELKPEVMDQLDKIRVMGCSLDLDSYRLCFVDGRVYLAKKEGIQAINPYVHIWLYQDKLLKAGIKARDEGAELIAAFRDRLKRAKSGLLTSDPHASYKFGDTYLKTIAKAASIEEMEINRGNEHFPLSPDEMQAISGLPRDILSIAEGADGKFNSVLRVDGLRARDPERKWVTGSASLSEAYANVKEQLQAIREVSVLSFRLKNSFDAEWAATITRVLDYMTA